MNSEKTAGASKPSAPQWAMQPFDDFMDFVERLGEGIELSIVGISNLQNQPKILGLATKYLELRGTGTSDSKPRLESAQRLAELAHRESSSGFPLIHAHATVTLYGAMEDSIRTFVAKWLQEVPEALLKPPLSTLKVAIRLQSDKVAIGEYEKLSPEDKGVFLADALDRSINGALKKGVDRFEALLEPLGFSGAVRDEVRRDIYELGQVRNVIVHRRAIADRKLLEACPWLAVSPGSPLVVSHQDFNQYADAAVSYVLELFCRVSEHFGVSDMRDKLAHIMLPKTYPKPDDGIRKLGR